MGHFQFNSPYRTFRFRVDITGLDGYGGEGATAQFSNVTGMGVTTDVVEYREGHDPRDTPIKLPGMVKYGNVTFKRGMTGSQPFINWLVAALPGEGGKGHGVAIPQDIDIYMLDDGDAAPQDTGVHWKLIHAWPANLTLPDLNASSSEVAIETLEIVHEGIVFDEGFFTNTNGPTIREELGGTAEQAGGGAG